MVTKNSTTRSHSTENVGFVNVELENTILLILSVTLKDLHTGLISRLIDSSQSLTLKTL